ncbi:MAG: TIGR00730 family Rossman fold protein [Gemmatimonadales bacterium]|jgi:hypothetical protein
MAPSSTIRSVCVFCGSREGAQPVYRDAAARLAGELARRGVTLVFGGGRVGLMGVLADTALAAGGEAIGVMPRALVEREIAHLRLTRLHIVGTMHERKQLMADLADAFVLLPGGFGSWDEFCEIVTSLQLGIHAKPCGILNAAGYYAPLLAQIERAVGDGFIDDSRARSILVDDEPESLIARLSASARPLPARATPSPFPYT